MTKVSVILPIYNTEEYLKRCIDSVISQTLKDIEIILSTDGPEACNEICEEYAKKDPRIKIILNPGNYGAAINRGIEIARGEYIGIVEIDDWVEPTFYEKLYKRAKEYDADVTKADCYMVFSQEEKKHITYDGANKDVFNLFDYPDILIKWMPSIWSCIYKKSFLVSNNIYIPEKKVSFLDAYFHSVTLLKAKKYTQLKEPLYNYNKANPNASTNDCKNIWSSIDVLKETYDVFYKEKEIYNKIKEEFFVYIARNLKFFYSLAKDSNTKDKFWETAHKYIKYIDTKGLIYDKFIDLQARDFIFALQKYKTRPKNFDNNETKVNNSFVETIFSVKNSPDKRHKIIKILGIKICIKKNSK